jgi:hypothetical protein
MAWIKQRTAEYRITNNEFRRIESLRSIFIKKACPVEVRGRNPEGVFFSDPWLRGTGKRVESRIKARNRGWKPLPQAVSSPGSRFRVQRL